MTAKCAKKTQRILKYVNMVVEVGEIVSSKTILHRMNVANDLPTKRGTVPSYYVPISPTSLGMRLRIAKNFEKVPKTKNDRTHHIWRRVE